MEGTEHGRMGFDTLAGMGGEWGVGASLAMEALPTRARGLFSGILQQGYAVGYLIAAVIFFLVYPTFGWRALFIVRARGEKWAWQI